MDGWIQMTLSATSCTGLYIIYYYIICFIIIYSRVLKINEEIIIQELKSLYTIYGNIK